MVAVAAVVKLVVVVVVIAEAKVSAVTEAVVSSCNSQ